MASGSCTEVGKTNKMSKFGEYMFISPINLVNMRCPTAIQAEISGVKSNMYMQVKGWSRLENLGSQESIQSPEDDA